MSGLRSLIALALGLALGGLAMRFGTPGLIELVKLIKLPGELWLNLLKLTLIPLVFSLVASSTCATMARLGQGRMVRTSLVLIFAFLFLSATYGVVATQLWLGTGLVPFGIAPITDALTRPAAPGMAELIKGLIPTNIIAAASEGALAPVSLFALMFGVFAARTAKGKPGGMAEGLEHFAATMLAMVDWVLIAAPLAVFCLGVSLSMTLGIQAASFVGQYLTAMVVIVGSMMVLAYGGAFFASRQSAAPFRFRQFVVAALPAQALALGTQSSLATLPLMIKATTKDLALEAAPSRASLSLAVAIFRFTGPAFYVSGALIIAHLHGLALSPALLVLAIPMGVLANLSSASIPGLATIYAAKTIVMSALGLPLELLPLLVALDTIPDMLMTLCNVTADMALAAMVANREQEPSRG